MADHTDLAKEAAEIAAATLAAGAGKTVGYGGALVALLSSNAFYGAVGLLVAIGGFWMNWHYKRKEDRRSEAAARREQEEHDARMKRYLAGFDPLLPAAGPMGEET